MVLAIVLMSMTAVVFCTLVDPYGLFDTPRLAHLTAVKSAASARLRLSKAWGVDRVQPATIVTGSSVTNLGIDPGSPAWIPGDRPVFNLGIDGAKVDLQRRFLLHALALTHPRRVVVLTSFEDYEPDDAGEASLPALHVGADGQPNPDYAIDRAKDLVSAVFSMRALSDSVTTLVRQSGELLSYQTPLGFEIDGPEQQYSDLHGMAAALGKTDAEFAAGLLRWGPKPRWTLTPLADMIRHGLAAGAEVVVAIPPVHPDLVEVRRQVGIGERVDAWRADVAGLVTGLRSERVVLRDFSEIPPSGRQSPGPGRAGGFWDAVHFTPALGDTLIERIESGAEPADPDQQGGAGIDPVDIARIKALVAAVRGEVCGAGSCGAPVSSRPVGDVEARR